MRLSYEPRQLRRATAAGEFGRVAVLFGGDSSEREISLLSGKPRTATVTAATEVELLELVRPTFDTIVQTHPGVQGVIEAFYEKRKGSTAETYVRMSR